MKPYELKVGEKPFWVVDTHEHREAILDEGVLLPSQIGLIALAFFREKTYVDYAAVCRIDEDGEDWFSRVHEQYEWIDWMNGDVYKDTERRKQLRQTERALGRFITQFGWAPNSVLETSPLENEMESYIQHIVSKDEVDGTLRFSNDTEP